MSLLVVSVLAGLMSQNTLVPNTNGNNLGNTELNMAAWGANGNAITSITNNQGDQQMCSDGAGGAIIVWTDYRSGTYSDIYAQKINATGQVQWAANGVALCTATFSQYYPQICTDGAGGAIVTWQDERDGASNDQIYAIRINSAGVVQWTANGIGVCTNSYEQLYPQICSDGSGGAVITWEDRRGGTGMDIYAQKIKSDGSASWKSNGIPVCNGTAWQRYPKICSDGAGGAIVACLNQRLTTDYEIWAGRIYSTGVVPWNKSFCSVADLPLLDDLFDIVSDGANGAIITWQDLRGGTYTDIYAQRISSAGAALWTANGNAVCTATSDQKYPQICNTSSSGAIITWQDWRGSTWDIYAQRISSGGAPAWAVANGTAICTAVNDQQNPQLCSDGANGAIIVWKDKRGGSWDHVYTQRIDSSGNVQWITDGAAMCTAPNPKYLSEPCSDGALGAFIPYQYYSTTGDDVYVQRAYLALPETPILNPIAPNPSSTTTTFLNWTQCANATKYYLFKSTSEITTIDGLIPLVFYDTSIHTYTDVNWVNGTYYYAIIAGGILLNSSISNCENVTVAFPSGGPGIPAFELGFVFLGISLLMLFSIRKRSSLNLK